MVEKGKRPGDFSRELRPHKLKRVEYEGRTGSIFVPINNYEMHYWRGLKHNNILLCLDVFIVGDNECFKFIFEHYDFSLADVLRKKTGFDKKRLFWKFTKRGRVIGATEYLQNIILGVVDAAIFLSGKNLSHNNLGSLENIVFSSDRIPMVHNFRHSAYGHGRGASTDFKGIADLLREILKECNMKRADINLELRSLISFFDNFPVTMDPLIIKRHPALITAEERRNLVLSMGDYLNLGYSRWKAFNNHIWKESKANPSLSKWMFRALSKGCLQERARLCREEPSGLLKLTRNTYSHINDGLETPEYNDERLEKIFLKRFPNLFIEWFWYKEDIGSGLLNYRA